MEQSKEMTPKQMEEQRERNASVYNSARRIIDSWPQWKKEAAGMTKCNACGGPYHISTGHILSDNFVLCGPCALSFKDWLKGRMGAMQAQLKNKRTGQRMKESFHDAALKSTKGDVNVGQA